MGFEPDRIHGDALADVIDAVLDKGLVINADITVSLAGVELLGIKIRAALASFETAAKYGLEFPAGTNLQTPGLARHHAGRGARPRLRRDVRRRPQLGRGGTRACPGALRRGRPWSLSASPGRP